MAKTINHRSFAVRIFILVIALELTCATAQASPLLSYFETDGGACSWYYWDSTKLSEQNLLAKLPKCPELIFFDSQENSVYFTSGDSVYSLTLKHQSSPQIVAGLPKVSGEKRVLWIDKSSGKLRLLVVSDVEVKDIIRKDEKVFLKNVDGDLIEGIDKGMFIGGISYAPMWESPQLLTIFELVSNDKWQRKAELASEVFFGLSRAQEVWKDGATNWDDVEISPNWNERGLSEYSASTDICSLETEWRCVRDLSDFVTPKAEARIAHYFRKISDPELFYVSFKQTNTAIVFNTIFGDTMHAVLPLLFCKDKCNQQLPLNVSARPVNTQVRLTVAFPYLLVVDDVVAVGSNPNVVDLRTGEIVFKPSGFGAMWLTSP